jgi:hypothetical protein
MKKHVFCIALSLWVLSAGAAFAQSLPDGWSSLDIGAVGAAGSATGNAGSFTVTGAGADIWGSADAFRFVYTTLTGDGSIVTQVTAVQDVANWTKAGVMMRETLAPGSRQAFMLVSAAKGLAFQRRLTTNGLSTNTSGAMAAAPYFVKLTRTGNVFAASSSTDGLTWTTVGSATIAMAATIEVGLAVSSHVAGALATASFDSTMVAAAPVTTATETIVFMRHGEKPAAGLGQLNCQGLQRAMMLPTVLKSAYGIPQSIYAPNPETMIPDAAGLFYYIRPLATIEPTAVGMGLPINTQFGYNDINSLQAALVGGSSVTSTVFVAWEHVMLATLVQNIMNAYGGGVAVPAWPADDFDSLYVVRLTNVGGVITAQFQHDFEGLNNLSTVCP